MFCVNSVAHWIGSSTYDDKHTPRDHFLTALITLGEGYHNFHHQFPMDYRNAVKYYQFDPTKWFIYACEQLGLAFGLQRFSSNEIRKGSFAMAAKKLLRMQQDINWGKRRVELPVLDWSVCTSCLSYSLVSETSLSCVSSMQFKKSQKSDL